MKFWSKQLYVKAHRKSEKHLSQGNAINRLKKSTRYLIKTWYQSYHTITKYRKKWRNPKLLFA